MTSSLPGFLVFGALSAMLLLGVLLRAKIKFLQNAMIPASLIGGVIGFILVSLGWVKYFSPDFSWVTITAADFLPFTFHAFNISFISLCLTRSDNSASSFFRIEFTFFRKAADCFTYSTSRTFLLIPDYSCHGVVSCIDLFLK